MKPNHESKITNHDERLPAGLHIVGTPIGNLSDMSPRAIDVLRRADLIACEDTRVFGKLAAHFDIKTKKVSFHEHNERAAVANLTDKIQNGAAVAVVSDAGMPGISDPGFRIARECRAVGLPVFVVPGPVAAIAALVLSGFPTDRFTFCGFFDEKKARDDNRIRHTIIYYESPNRVMATVAALALIMPERRIAIVREITKIHEETIIGYAAELMRIEPPRGEIVIVIEPAPETKMSDDEISEIVNDVVAASTKSAAADVAARSGISKKEAYRRLIKKDGGTQ
ncbi:MAG: 16S rRNA (cytidine(1402)-2'-O)-methyltransferase [Rickettsiales bacterium]|jgi:16S rRNA (cytidine1402-2'-O)-methyltransferase|nr:16S rRNA (cytidine(1402)-2'-O)-methyltransferase [Rickettsiales bacterium]